MNQLVKRNFALIITVLITFLVWIFVYYSFSQNPPEESTKSLSADDKKKVIDLWFTAIDFNCRPDAPLLLLLKVAVMSALTHTSLIPVVLAIGDNREVESWLRNLNVLVIKRFETPIIQYLNQNSQYLTNLGTSTWLRMAIPEIVEEIKISRIFHNRSVHYDYVLYTDADVYFTSYFHLPVHYFPRYVAFAIQGDIMYTSQLVYARRLHTNAGVMVVNVTSSPEWTAKFEKFMVQKVQDMNQNPNALHKFSDQTAFHYFFPVKYQPTSLFDYFSLVVFHSTYSNSLWPKFYSDVLPKVYEWEPYLGANPDAMIVHWHGHKLNLPNNCSIIYDEDSVIGYQRLWDLTNLTKAELITMNRKLISDPSILPQSGSGYRHEIIRLFGYIRKLCKAEVNNNNNNTPFHANSNNNMNKMNSKDEKKKNNNREVTYEESRK